MRHWSSRVQLTLATTLCDSQQHFQQEIIQQRQTVELKRHSFSINPQPPWLPRCRCRGKGPSTESCWTPSESAVVKQELKQKARVAPPPTVPARGHTSATSLRLPFPSRPAASVFVSMTTTRLHYKLFAG